LVTGKQVAAGLLAASAAEKVVEKFKAHARQFVEQGGVVEDGGRRWCKGEDVVRKEKLSVDEGQFRELCIAFDAGNFADKFLAFLKAGGYFGEKKKEGAWKWRKMK
jgi:hypothetical protein